MEEYKAIKTIQRMFADEVVSWNTFLILTGPMRMLSLEEREDRAKVLIDIINQKKTDEAVLEEARRLHLIKV